MCALLLRGKAQPWGWQCVLSVGMSAGTWLLSQLWKLLDHSLICLVLLWLLQPHLCPLPLVPSHADLLLAVVLLSHETLAALSSCFVAHFCKSRLVDSIPSTTDEETSAPLILHHLFSLSPCQGASAHICLYPDVPFQGRLLEKAERWSFLMGKLVDLIRMEEHIPRKHVMFQQSPRDCVCGHKKCCLSYA